MVQTTPPSPHPPQNHHNKKILSQGFLETVMPIDRKWDYKLQNLHLCFATFTFGYKSLPHRLVHLPAWAQQGTLWPKGL